MNKHFSEKQQGKILFRIIIVSLAFIIAAVIGCGKDPKKTTTTFTNKLTIGTGMNGFDLIGEGTTFSLAATGGNLYFRFENSSDFNGQTARIQTFYAGGGPYGGTADKDVAAVNGHIVVSGFRITNTGSYQVQGSSVPVGGGSQTQIATVDITMGP